MTNKKFEEVIEAVNNYNVKVQFTFTQEGVDALRQELKAQLEKLLSW